ncbi:hypothetical protein BDY17DRAFT_249493 [Neohortaea acidophila]|uniref:Thioredoxin domain-containing protein n=1 Tax=Neohortaea acidophila TaxID=245834 RepID=A0A6A6PXC2_9PEZI|nr:uncharacterized protein BDY17DRAFT_249493 [Neohortaea acidophila]KAF2484143.1 hypothetical protein BDY17DRAFT_249493 [Neohortaea acidophila]
MASESRPAPLRLGYTAPNFQAETTHGPIDFHEFIGNNWVVLFSHPEDFTPVCTTELGAFAKLEPEFTKRGVKLIGLSANTIEKHGQWIEDINEISGSKLSFPIIGDKQRQVALLYDMIDHQDATNVDEKGIAFTIRSVFIIDPKKSIRLILSYPASTGRNTAEVLRVVDSLQTGDKHKVTTPINWLPGDDVIVHPSVKTEDAKNLFPKMTIVKPYLRFTPLPPESSPSQAISIDSSTPLPPGSTSATPARVSGYEDDAGSHVASQTTGAAHPGHSHTTSTPLMSNIAGLACTTHRTTGQEPHPLVGATTTILGDKLYVFGGRRLSRMKPQLTSNLYELDLLKRHWTKLETGGDIPPARYFHSVCALGDTKLVCYGGMSPSPAAVESNGEAPPEVIVMSDIHIFDVPTKTWMKINTPDPPQGRYAHCAAILPSSAVFASASAPLSGIHHNLPGGNPHQGSLGVTLDGAGGAEMVVVGGQDSANHYIEQVSVFNLRSLKWTGTTSMGRSCGAYRSVVTPLTTLSASQIGGGPHAKNELDEDDDEPTTVGSGSPMLIYSNYNFLDVKLELQVRLPDGTLTEKKMQTNVSPPGLRFPNGGVLANHFVVSGTFLTSSKQEYALWALDLRTLTWSRVDVGGGIFSRGSWNRGVLWSRRNTFVILGNRKRSLVDDYNNRRINFSNLCLVELEIFGMYDNPRRTSPMSGFVSGSTPFSPEESSVCAVGRTLSPAAEDLGLASMNVSELADMDFLAIDGTRIAVNSRLIARRWGPHFTNLLKESLAMSNETDTATLRPSVSGHPSRNSIVTITPSVTSTNTTLTANSASEVFDPRSAPPMSRPRLFYLPHTAPTLQALLHYLYTSTLPAAGNPLATPQIFCSLLQLARPYKIDGLLEATLERLHEFLDGANAVALFNAAAMGAGGGEGVQFAPSSATFRDSAIPLRGASLDATSIVNGGSTSSNNSSRATSALRIDTDMANGSDDEVPDSANTDTSLSDFESSSRGGLLSARTERQAEIWRGTLSAVVGLQKRGLRGLMEGRRIRERGVHEGKVGLGIA